MRIVYNILFLFFFLLSAPFYFIKMWRRGNWKGGFQQRFGNYSSKIKQAISNRDVVWLHAVSVGEVNICTQLIQRLEPRVPNLKFVVSTTTSTGMEELKKKLPNHIEKIYYPIDSRRIVHKAIITLHPCAIILVEAEIWPNFLWKAHDLEIPTFLVNARLSERSLKGYRRSAFLFRPLFAQFAGIGCQNQEDARKLETLGARPEAIHIVGNLKYDAAPLVERRGLNVPALFHQLGFPSDAQVLIGGITHAGEEKLLGEIFLRLQPAFPKLRLIIVPRHFERGKEVGAELEDLGLSFAYRSEVSATTQYEPGAIHCLLVNTTGELKYFYEYSTLIFVGKSLTAEGGQNPLEPGALGKPMVFGPNMQNFEAIATALVQGGGAVQVQNPAELEMTIRDLLPDEARRKSLGVRAAQIIRENAGGIERTVEMILEHFKNEEVYVVNKS